MSQRIASGHGLATISLSGAVLDTWFPEPMLGNLSNPVLPFLSALAGVDEIRGVKREVVSLEIDLDKAPETVSDAYLRLHLLSTFTPAARPPATPVNTMALTSKRSIKAVAVVAAATLPIRDNTNTTA